MEQNNQVQYTWKPEDKFTLLGKNYESLINYVNMKLNNQEAQEIIFLYEFSKELDKMMQDGVMSGTVKVIKPEAVAQAELEKEEAPN